MRPFDDDEYVRALEDDLLSGRPVPTEPELVAFVAALRVTAEDPAPSPSLALAAVLRDGLAPPSATASPVRALAARGDRSRPRHPMRTAAGLGLAAKILLGAGIAAASVTGAATIDAVPDAVQRPASAIVSGILELFGTGAAAPEHAPARPAPARSGTGLPDGGSGTAGPDAAPGAPTVAPPTTVVVPDPDLPLPLPVVPPVELPVPTGSGAIPDLRGLLRSPDGSGQAPLVVTVPPVVVVPPIVAPGAQGP